jgi:type IV secretion system protein TrbG
MKLVPPPPVRSAAGLLAQPAATTEQIVAEANRQASQGPARDSYFNAIAQYAYEPGTLYQLYASPMRITDIVLEPGEKVIGQPAAGDVVRWVLALGKSIAGGQEQAHVYVKPTRADLETNLAINTDRRSYMLELHSYADTYMAAVEWHYPHDEMARLQAQEADAAADVRNSATVVGLDSLNFHYVVQVEKGEPTWAPVQVFDDGRRTFIRFPEAMLVREAPALFVLRNKETQLVNYRVKNDFYVVDRLIDSAELRVGQQEQEIVRITRAPAGRK